MPSKSQSDSRAARLLRAAAAASLVTSVLFIAFFQLAKTGPFRAVSSFGDDPYDAVGSIAIQLALFSATLAFARTLRPDPFPGRASLVIRGVALTLAVILVSLLVDAVAEAVTPQPPSFWSTVLIAGLATLVFVAVCCSMLLAVVVRSVGDLPPPPANLTPADALDDLRALPMTALKSVIHLLSYSIAVRLREFTSDKLFSHIPGINPRIHPWRFATLLGFIVGALLSLAQFREGIPSTLQASVAVAGIFISVEVAVTISGLALLGKYLALRPSGPALSA